MDNHEHIQFYSLSEEKLNDITGGKEHHLIAQIRVD